MSRNSMEEMLRSVMASGSDDDITSNDPEYLEKLRTAFAIFAAPSPAFKPGDLVTWKDGMRNRKSAGPLVVVQMLETPVFANEDESGTAFFREPLDMIAGLVDKDGDFLCYHYDSRRFTLYEGETVN